MLALPTVAVTVQWLGERLLDGSCLGAAVWLASVTLLKRASGRLLAWVWLGALLGFVVVRPIALQPWALPQGAASVPFVSQSSQLSQLSGWCFAAYACVVGGLLGRLCIAHGRLRRRVEGYALAASDVQLRVAAVAQALALSPLPQVRVTEVGVGPFTFGPIRPTLVLPGWLCAERTRLDAVLFHELSHLKRQDHRWIWLQRGVTALYFFFPPVHWVSRRLEDARELACDEQALQAGGYNAADYSANLLQVVAAQREARSLGGALALGPNAQRLEWRISRLLDSTRCDRAFLFERACMVLLAACGMLTLRPAPANQQPALDQALPTADSNTQALPDDSSEGANMCLPPDLNAPCVLQGCGTQCAP